MPRRRTGPRTLDPFVVSARERCVRIKSIHSDGRSTTGTGVILQTGVVVTNWHLVEDPKIIRTTVNDHDARMVHFDFRYDLAAFVCRTRKLRGVRIQRQLAHQTQEVFYVGNPDDWTKTIVEGTVVKVTKNAIRSSNRPAVGFSGSGLYARKTGELVGLIDSMEGGVDNGYNFTISVPSPILLRFVAEVSPRVKLKEVTPPSIEEAREKIVPFPSSRFDFG